MLGYAVSCGTAELMATGVLCSSDYRLCKLRTSANKPRQAPAWPVGMWNVSNHAFMTIPAVPHLPIQASAQLLRSSTGRHLSHIPTSHISHLTSHISHPQHPPSTHNFMLDDSPRPSCPDHRNQRHRHVVQPLKSSVDSRPARNGGADLPPPGPEPPRPTECGWRADENSQCSLPFASTSH
jgi:hypothetical protein